MHGSIAGATIDDVHLPRTIELSGDARSALATVLGIMTDQVMGGEAPPRWELEDLLMVEMRFGITLGVDDVSGGGGETTMVTVGMGDVALLLDGMAYTEVMSADLPWIDMVRWTADFITAELRGHWTDAEWQAFAAAGG